MSLSASQSRVIFRACVVNAVRAGEPLMQRLITTTKENLAEQEEQAREIRRRDLFSDALVFLKQQEAALLKSYPLALLEEFAGGGSPAQQPPKVVEQPDSAGLDFGELSLMDDDEVSNQIDMAKAQQIAALATEAVLAELNTLVSSAQGLQRVQPERNPLRPESYIKALTRSVNETGVPADIRQLWMQTMREMLGKALVDEYKSIVASLRKNGIEPVGYAVAGIAGGTRSAALTQVPLQAPQTGYGQGFSPSQMMGVPSDFGNWSAGSMNGASSLMHPYVEEALLTVEILHQMLAAGDPFQPQMHSRPGAITSPSGSSMSTLTSAVSGLHMPSQFGANAATEALEDIAQLEQLVGRLSATKAGAGGMSQLPPSHGSVQVQAPQGGVAAQWAPVGQVVDSPAVALDVLKRMLENMSNDQRLLPPVKQALQALTLPLQQLVQVDWQFFSDAQHPARLLLDELTQRSLAFESVNSAGFPRFSRLLDRGVKHLSTKAVKDAAPFQTVLRALQSAWDAPAPEPAKAAPSSQRVAPAMPAVDPLADLAKKIGDSIRQLPGVEDAPDWVLDFASGPWAQVAATAQIRHAQGQKNEGEIAGVEGDPGAHLALVPLLLWSAQPLLTRAEPSRLRQAIPGLISRLRDGLKTIDYPPTLTSQFLQKLTGLHQLAFKVIEDPPEPVVEQSPMFVAANPGGDTDGVASAFPTPDDGPETVASPDAALADSMRGDPDGSHASDPYAQYQVGVWVDIMTNGSFVHTQLTWASPHGTLFLFTGANYSTQSMTRRMRNKLVKEGALRISPTQGPLNGTASLASQTQPASLTKPDVRK